MIRIWKCLKALQSIGIYPDLPYLEGKKIQMLNLIVLFCIPLTFFFTCTNFIGGRPFLAFINVCCFITSCSTIILHHYRYYKTARSTLIIFNLIFFTMGGYFFHNGAEYLLLCVLIVTLLVYDNIYIQILASCATILAIILVIFYPSSLFSENYVPLQRVMFNFVSAISFLLIIIAVFKDIQYTYQKKIAEQHAQLKQMNSTMENIFSIIAHDIKEPLTSIYDMLSLIEKNMITQQTAQENAATIKLRITLLNDALDNLLRWGERNMQGTSVHRTDVSMAVLYEEVYRFLMPQAKQKAIIWNENIEKNIIAYIDRDQILIVLRNILSNAIKYSFFGGTIHFSAMRKHGKVVIEIKDTGIGMTQEQLSGVFNHIQVPAHGTQGERGSGFGLFLCRELLLQNNGDFSVTSRPNVGSVFSISLPLSQKTDAQ